MHDTIFTTIPGSPAYVGEKNVSWGRTLSAPLGVLLVISGFTVLALT